jgi:hypothetical protein
MDAEAYQFRQYRLSMRRGGGERGQDRSDPQPEWKVDEPDFACFGISPQDDHRQERPAVPQSITRVRRLVSGPARNAFQMSEKTGNSCGSSTPAMKPPNITASSHAWRSWDR